MNDRARINPEFWLKKSLYELSHEEWEALCDGCGKCCLHKLEDDESGMIYYTDVACWLLDLATGRCSDYAKRRSKVPDCLQLSPLDPDIFVWLPSTCAYRCLYEARALPDWHYLVCGDRHRVHEVGQSVRGRAVAERLFPDLERRIVSWPA